MNIFEALFGFKDIYQKAQEKRKKRIERKQVLENCGFGRMPQEDETNEQPFYEREDSRDEVRKEMYRKAEPVLDESLSEVKELLKKADEILSAYDEVQKSMEDQTESLRNMQKSLEEHCGAIEEKIHSENVKSYRNVQAALDDMNKGVAKEESLVILVSGLRTQLKCVTWFSVITLLVLIAYILFSLGVF